MLGVDLTAPIVILGVAVGIVLSLRAAVAWAERRAAERTERLLRELAAEASDEVKEPSPPEVTPDGEPGTQA